MKSMAKEAGFVGKFTNHSLRKTMCNTLLQAGVAPTLIQQMSGHKNVASISNYASASKKQQREMDDIVANPGLSQANATTGVCEKPQQAPISHSSLASASSCGQAGQFAGANITSCTFNFN